MELYVLSEQSAIAIWLAQGPVKAGVYLKLLVRIAKIS
jgi:hypothetical protein